MNPQLKLRVKSSLILVALLSVANIGHAAGKVVSAQLEERLRLIESLLAKGDTERLAKEWYWPDVVIDGESSPQAYRSLQEFKPTLVAESGSASKCTFSMPSPVAASETQAAVFIEMACKAPEAGKPEMKFRALWVWQKREGIWKVVREAYLVGPWDRAPAAVKGH